MTFDHRLNKDRFYNETSLIDRSLWIKIGGHGGTRIPDLVYVKDAL
jgi:hypothetical protein